MNRTLLPTTEEIADLFTERIVESGGTLTTRHDDGRRLLASAVMPIARDVRPGDAIHGGVALRTHEADVYVYPYLFRHVCRNGAVTAWAAGTSRVERVDFAAAPEAMADFRAELAIAIDACADGEYLAESVDRMKKAARSPLTDARDLLLTMLTRRWDDDLEPFIDAILAELDREGDRTRYGLMNAITAVARETADPDDRHRLEELGGGVLATSTPAPRPLNTAVLV